MAMTQEAIQLALLDVDRGQIISAKPRDEKEREEKLHELADTYWQRDVKVPFRTSAYSWKLHQSTKIALAGGYDVENISAEWAESDSADSLETALSESLGYGIPSDLMMRMAEKEARLMRTEIEGGEWAITYLPHFLDIYQDATGLSERKKQRLMQSLVPKIKAS